MAPGKPELRDRTSWTVFKTGDATNRRMARTFWGVGTLKYLPPNTPNKLAEILRQAVRETYKDRQFHEQYKKVIGIYPTPLMGEEQQKLVAALPRDTEVIKVFKTISGIDPLPGAQVVKNRQQA